MDEGLHREQESPCAPGDCKESRVKAGERLLSREDADLVDEVSHRGRGRFRGPSEELEQELVVIGLAQKEDGLVGEDLGGDVGAVPRSHVVDETRKDNPVHSGWDCNRAARHVPRKSEGAELAATSPPPTSS